MGKYVFGGKILCPFHFCIAWGKVATFADFSSVADPYHFYAAPALGKIFDAALAAPAPTPLYGNFLKTNKINLSFLCIFDDLNGYKCEWEK
jgi:hypothetical protein